jgi:hypothetical protein
VAVDVLVGVGVAVGGSVGVALGTLVASATATGLGVLASSAQAVNSKPRINRLATSWPMDVRQDTRSAIYLSVLIQYCVNQVPAQCHPCGGLRAGSEAAEGVTLRKDLVYGVFSKL